MNTSNVHHSFKDLLISFHQEYDFCDRSSKENRKLMKTIFQPEMYSEVKTSCLQRTA